jgi:hypothetical protein
MLIAYIYEYDEHEIKNHTLTQNVIGHVHSQLLFLEILKYNQNYIIQDDSYDTNIHTHTHTKYGL